MLVSQDPLELLIFESTSSQQRKSPFSLNSIYIPWIIYQGGTFGRYIHPGRPVGEIWC